MNAPRSHEPRPGSATVPASAAVMQLAGHSGAHLSLIEQAGRLLVRKISGSPGQNTRLRAQCEKLVAMHENGFPCPIVVRQDEADGIFFFDMEFVPGETLAHAVLSGQPMKWPVLLPPLLGFIERLRATNSGLIAPGMFTAKLAQIGDACRRSATTAPYSAEVDRVIATLQAQDWTGIPASNCHGDLTLENVLLRQDQTISFIDFDVPEHQSWCLDIAKLFQDLLGHWCLRSIALKDADSVEMVNGQIALGRVATNFERVFVPLLPGGRAMLGRLVAFHLLRTLPYVTETPLCGYVLRRIWVVLAPGP